MFKEAKTKQDAAELEWDAEGKGAFLWLYSYILDRPIWFHAYLTSYSDSFSSNWSQESVYGRMDPIATFQNTQRKINVAFTIPNTVNREDTSAMDKVNSFFKMLYPKYENSGNALTLSQGPLLRLKFANLIAKAGVAPGNGSVEDIKATGLLGYVTNLSFQPKIEHGFSYFDGKMYPNFLDLSFEFSVLHETEDDIAFFNKSGFPYGEFVEREDIEFPVVLSENTPSTEEDPPAADPKEELLILWTNPMQDKLNPAEPLE